MNEEVAALFSSDVADDAVQNINLDKNCLSPNIVLGKTVCYIAGAVLINDENEILLIQEAKASCRGSWYLPAGRVEPNEALVDSVKREVLEESGLIMKPTGLVCLEENGGRWVRFIFAGVVVGGKLKTLKESDSESLQAGWFKDPESVKLRSRDILSAIDKAKCYYSEKQINPNFYRILPVLSSHKSMLIRTLILQQTDDLALHILLTLSSSNASTAHHSRIPVSRYELFNSIGSSINRVVRELILDLDLWNVEILGLLRLEHSGSSNDGFDGICLTVLANLSSSNSKNKSLLPKVKSGLALWHQLDSSLLPNFEFIHDLKNFTSPIVTFH